MVNSKQENIPSPRTVGNDENFISKFEASGYGCRLPKKNVVGNAQMEWDYWNWRRFNSSRMPRIRDSYK